MDKNKTRKYLKYAIGEVILVVFGILIALYINNLNEVRKDRRLEQNYLSKIHEEFKKNKEQFEFITSIHKNSYNSSNWILKNYNSPDINIDTLRKHLRTSRFVYTYNPSKSSIDALINSGNFDVIRNKELSTKLLEWQELITDYKEEEIHQRTFADNVMIPFDIINFSIYSEEKDKRFDNFLNFDEETKLQYLNIIATKRRLTGNIIIDNPKSEYNKILESLNIIISNSAQK